MMLRAFMLGAVLVVTGLSASAAEDPPGAYRNIDFTVTWRTQGNTTINHLFKGVCRMIVSLPSETGLDGQGENKAHRETREDLAAEMQACKQDIQCIQRVAGKIERSSAVRAEKNYVLWGETGCSNVSLTANDRIVSRDCQLGEGGTRCSTTTTVTKGATAVQPCPNCMRIQHDLKRLVTEYRFVRPDVPVVFDERSTSDDGRPESVRKVKALPFPDGVVPPPMTLPGPPQSGKIVRPVPGGEVVFEWIITR